jgi:cation diffusion facilitator CzcD-associated flavoprotein CzcO
VLRSLINFIVSEMSEFVEILIVGSGPTGLGAASRLVQHKCDDWLLIDAFAEAVGLA